MEENVNSDSQDMLSFMWLVRSWLLDCSANGIPRILTSTNVNRKIFWILSVLICSALFVYQTTEMILDVYSYPVTVSLQIKHFDQLQFPAVTVCNSNKFKASLVDGDSSNNISLELLSNIAAFNSFKKLGILISFADLIVTAFY